ncbi:hypothetical protein IM678_21895 [Dickeya fangzhongdai]|nr:hypothetical protein [Dickeya fangzhongdai]
MTKVETRLCDKTVLRVWCYALMEIDKNPNPAACRENSLTHHKVIFSYFQG